MKKTVSVLLGFMIIFQLSGCVKKESASVSRDDTAYDEKADFAASLTLNYDILRKKYPEQKNDIFCYVNAQNKIPEGREIKFCMEDFNNPYLHEGKTFNITASGIEVSDEHMLYTDGRYFPLETVLAMTGKTSLDEVMRDIGQPRVYEELGDFCAFLVENTASDFDVVYYGIPEHTDTVELKNDDVVIRSLQITEDSIYCFTLPDKGIKQSVTVSRIPRNGGEVDTKKILYSDISFPEVFSAKFIENIFVDNDYLFYLAEFVTSVEPLHSEFYILAYDLKTDGYDVYKTSDIDNVGKVFRYGSGLGFVTSMFDEHGYQTKTGIRFLNFDEANCKFSLKEELLLSQSENWSYSMGILSEHFYCIYDKLCGIMSIKDNSASLAYVEIDLANGTVTTCVPFAKIAKKEYKNLFYGSFTIRDNGKGVSEHNCS